MLHIKLKKKKIQNMILSSFHLDHLVCWNDFKEFYRWEEMMQLGVKEFVLSGR